MEKRLQIIAVIFSVFCFSISAQNSQEGVSQEKVVRFALWAQTDVYPGYFREDASDSEKEKNIVKNGDTWSTAPVKKIREIAPFLVEGMLYGWRFTYTPYDKARGVQEFFEFSPVNSMSDEEKNRIGYKFPWVKDDKLYAWIEFSRTKSQETYFRSWTSLLHPKIKGVGFARLSSGFDGIYLASEEALKNAVREYFRKKIKTKPKEISGRVLICESPLIGIDAGRYRVTLDFFIESDRIIEYRTF